MKKDIKSIKIPMPMEGSGNHRVQLYEENHVKIEKFWEEFEKENNRIPTKKELAEGTGLSRPTIDNHIESISLDTFKHKHKIKMDKILSSLEKKAESGDVAAIKLYFQIVGSWVEKSETKTDKNETKTLRIEYVEQNQLENKQDGYEIDADYEEV